MKWTFSIEDGINIYPKTWNGYSVIWDPYLLKNHENENLVMWDQYLHENMKWKFGNSQLKEL